MSKSRLRINIVASIVSAFIIATAFGGPAISPTPAPGQPGTSDSRTIAILKQMVMDESKKVDEIAHENQRLTEENIRLEKSMKQMNEVLRTISPLNKIGSTIPRDWEKYPFAGARVYIVPLKN